MDTPQLQPHQYRVIREKAKLDEKINRLEVFLSGPRVVAADEEELKIMRRQAGAMKDYSNFLGQRIELHKSNASLGFPAGSTEQQS